jgi:acyl-CoA thioester hydrolase
MFETSFRVRYYETDAMGIVHHSNYLRWFELARTEYLRDIGTPYRAMEESGVSSPVLEIHCRYLQPSRYDDLITVRVRMTDYSAVRIELSYEVYCDGRMICDGMSRHAFLRAGRPISPARSAPGLHLIFTRAFNASRGDGRSAT